jgi:predicted XRE-type DNA-binding protein
MRKKRLAVADVVDADGVVTAASGNVFTDLGEAAVIGLRVDKWCQNPFILVKEENWTQAQAADRFGVRQSRVSDLLSGKWDKFSLDMFITLAARAGRKVALAAA